MESSLFSTSPFRTERTHFSRTVSAKLKITLPNDDVGRDVARREVGDGGYYRSVSDGWENVTTNGLAVAKKTINNDDDGRLPPGKGKSCTRERNRVFRDSTPRVIIAYVETRSSVHTPH